jgi:Interferon-induced transmembrane protein
MSDYGSTPPPPPPPPPPSQPPYGAQGAPGTPPPNYLVWAILSTLLCGCGFPLGIASIVFSTQVNSKWAVGDVAGAQSSSAKAKSFAIWAAVVGIAFAVLWVILVLVGVANADFNFNSSTDSGF